MEASVAVSGGRATSVTIRNVPSYLHLRDARVSVPGAGELTLDVAFGGNFYAILPASAAGLQVRPQFHDEIVAAGLQIMAAVNDQLEFAHPDNPEISDCRHVVFTAPAEGDLPARAAVAIHPGWVAAASMIGADLPRRPRKTSAVPQSGPASSGPPPTRASITCPRRRSGRRPRLAGRQRPAGNPGPAIRAGAGSGRDRLAGGPRSQSIGR